ncbi:MAG: hypothetical protein JW753_07270 [Dehalococcoidia bacterium]|nr:hypothetical protein [Dehalococcoidia bacterium]
MQPGAGAGQGDEDEGSITSGSPRNLVIVAAVVGLLIFASLVFFIAAVLGGSDGTSDNWWVAETILLFVSTGVFYAGLLVGLGTVATAGSRGASARAVAVASLLSKAGAVIIILGVAQAVSIVGASRYGDRAGNTRPTRSAFRMTGSVFEAGVLVGLALLCLHQSKPGNCGGNQGNLT